MPRILTTAALLATLFISAAPTFARDDEDQRPPDSADNPPKPPPAPAPATRPRGDYTGNYTLTISGHVAGSGTATVADTVSFTATITLPSGETGTLSAADLPIVNGYFTGAGTIMGIACTIHGRVDLPAADDAEQSDKQAVTGRITGTFKDANGNVGRIVAVQQNPAPAPSTPPDDDTAKGTGSKTDANKNYHRRRIPPDKSPAHPAK